MAPLKLFTPWLAGGFDVTRRLSNCRAGKNFDKPLSQHASIIRVDNHISVGDLYYIALITQHEDYIQDSLCCDRAGHLGDMTVATVLIRD